jgi:hypothetical protein
MFPPRRYHAVLTGSPLETIQAEVKRRDGAIRRAGLRGLDRRAPPIDPQVRYPLMPHK